MAVSSRWILGRLEIEERGDDGDAVAERIGQDAGHGGVERHPDPAALVGVVVEAVSIRAFEHREHVDRQRNGESAVVDARMRGVPYREATGAVQAGKKERSAQCRNDERQRRNDWNRVQPRHAIEQSRSRREVEDRQGDGRKGERACDPREDGQYPGAKRQDAFLAEQRTAAADAAERQRQHAQTRGQVVAAHQQQDECRAGKDRHLHDHPEMPPRPAVGAGVPDRGAVQRRQPRRTCRGKNHPLNGAPDTHAVVIPPLLQPLRDIRRRRLEYRVCESRGLALQAMDGGDAITLDHLRALAPPGAQHLAVSAAGLPGATRTTSQWTREVLSNVWRTRLDRQVRGGSPARSAPAPAGQR